MFLIPLPSTSSHKGERRAKQKSFGREGDGGKMKRARREGRSQLALSALQRDLHFLSPKEGRRGDFFVVHLEHPSAGEKRGDGGVTY